MRLGIVLSSSRPDESPLTGEGLIAQARAAEDLGFDDAILVPRRPTPTHLAALRALQ